MYLDDDGCASCLVQVGDDLGPVAVLGSAVLDVGDPLGDLLGQWTGLLAWKQRNVDVLALPADLLDRGDDGGGTGTKGLY